MLAAAAAGVVLGVGVEAGGALLLYAGGGALRGVGLLAAFTLAALAAGLWAGAPRDGRADSTDPTGAPAPPTRWRWLGAVAAFLLAAVFAAVWMEVDAMRAAALGRALAVVFFLAGPAYALGMLLAALATRSAGVAVAALGGAALGVLGAAVLLIPEVSPAPLLFSGSAVLAVAGIWEVRPEEKNPEPRGGSMRGKIVIVTGVGARGQVGYAVARALLDAGARVVVTDIAAGVEALAGELEHRGEVTAIRADLTEQAGAERVVTLARERYGRLDALINVAGGLTAIGQLAETEPESWREEIERNATTAYLMSRAALPLLREGGGAVVSFAAPAGLRADANLGAYSAAKAGVVALTRTLALEERGRGVRANALAPGMIDTAQNREMEDPDEVDWVTREQIARVALFLATDDSSGINGETIRVLGTGVE